MDYIWHDFKASVRVLRQTAFVVRFATTLALGMGASVALFSLVYNVIWYPFPYQHSDSSYVIQAVKEAAPNEPPRRAFTLEEVAELTRPPSLLADVIVASTHDVLYDTPDGPEQIRGAFVSPPVLASLGVPRQSATYRVR